MPVTAVAALPSIAANNDAVRLLQEAMAQAARIVADAHTQAKGILAEALQERESTRLERAQIVQERESILADARCAQSCFTNLNLWVLAHGEYEPVPMCCGTCTILFY